MRATPEYLADRNKLIDAYWESERKTSWPVSDTLTSNQRKREYARQDHLLEQYSEALPFVPVSRCPFCETALEYVFDPFGLDGLWWEKDKLAEYASPVACAHFRVLLGAIDFHGRPPDEARQHDLILPGPGCPFVVPRLLELPEMLAVVSSYGLPHGDTAYLIAYFSRDPLHGGLLHQPWCRELYEVFNEQGEYEGWTACNDIWDFDLRPWIEKGLFLWIAAGDDALELIRPGGPPCEYLDLGGVRAPQTIVQGVVDTLPLPDGQPLEPFE